MNAQQKMIEYAKSRMSADSTLTPEQWCGKMISEGIVISREVDDIVVARAKREGKTIVITETAKTQRPRQESGKLTIETTETVKEVMRIDL